MGGKLSYTCAICKQHTHDCSIVILKDNKHHLKTHVCSVCNIAYWPCDECLLAALCYFNTHHPLCA